MSLAINDKRLLRFYQRAPRPIVISRAELLYRSGDNRLIKIFLANLT